MPFIGTLQTHPVRMLLEDGGEVVVAVHEGFVQVSDDTVTLLSDICEMAGDIDVGRAESAKARAAEALKADAADRGGCRHAEAGRGPPRGGHGQGARRRPLTFPNWAGLLGDDPSEPARSRPGSGSALGVGR